MSATKFAGSFDAFNFAYGINPSVPSLQVLSGSPNSGTYTLTAYSGYGVTPDGVNFAPLNTNGPILVGEGASAETVTPSAVSNTTPASLGTTLVTATFAYAHSIGDQIRSGSVGLQEAINFAAVYGGGTVVVDARWALFGGTSAMIAAASIPSTVAIVDQRDASGSVQTATIVIPNAQVLTLFSAGTQLLPAPGATSAYDVIDMLVDYSYLTAAFTGGGAIQASYGTGVTYPATATIPATFLTSPSANTIIKVAGGISQIASANILNKAITLDAATANFAAGGGSLTVKLTYRLLTNLS